MRKAVRVIATALVVPTSAAAWACTCPVVIKQADDPIKKAEAGKLTPQTKRDHGDAVRKARPAVAFAEEAIILQSP